MNLLSTPVLGSAAALVSPALWDAFVTGELPVEAALLRFGVAALACWVGLSVFALLVRAPAGEEPAPPPAGAPTENNARR